MNKKKVLIVDDEKDFTDMIKMNLEERGDYEVKAENKGMKALAAAKTFKPDLILLDVIIKDKDGGSVRHELKSDPVTKEIPIVFLTATVDENQVPEDDNMIGGYTFLSKPVSVEKLISCIDNKIAEYRGY
jgi:CheY-like chemotaxis protein